MKLSLDKAESLADSVVESALETIERSTGDRFSEAQWEQVHIDLAPQLAELLSEFEFPEAYKP